MPLLLRTAGEAIRRKQQLMPLLLLTSCLVTSDDIYAAACVTNAIAMGVRMLIGPSRSWQKGINRVTLWCFENLYTETQCWERLRIRKHDMHRLATALQLPDESSSTIPKGRAAHHLVISPRQIWCGLPPAYRIYRVKL